MAEITLVAETGRKTGSAESRRLRAAGLVPAVVYGHGADAISVSVDGRALRHALTGGAGLNQLLSLQVGSDTRLALAREIQRHPVRHTVLHVDFQVVRRDEVISADVPIVVVGEAKEVEAQRGLVEHLLTSLTVNATPDRIPPSIEVDVSAMTIGEGIRVADLPLPEGVTTDVLPDEMVVIASLSRAAMELEEAEAGAEEAGGAAGPDAGDGAGGPAAQSGGGAGAGGEG
jgi:large subunit ribosomal protein L25